MDEEKDILRRISQGDSDAFRVVFLKYAPRVEAFAMKILKNIHEAQDVSQNIFIKLWAQREHLAHLQSLNAYLFRMARNAVLDVCKHSRVVSEYKNHSLLTGAVESNDLAERVDTLELAGLVEAALKKMPRRRCEVYRLSREAGKSNREIAKELSISSKSVENHITKALCFIKKEIS
ncbi:RNA polymerase sigma-70 factor [uncultured Alistipes sp.]|jgi:RNA polymerase sigma-70 factor|uniref:RNA polymerase sigma-70 factor n=1 Tax=uncultured Alistipes sp. TaxID=538949 RepID=UPI0025F16F25|nr:RNA polymerase sigma-70 factor [uncultured Alistipes sp.]